MLTVSDLSKSYDGVLALRMDRLEAAPGETLVLIGASGSGKSTLLRLLMGLLPPDRGSVRLGDIAVNPAAGLELRRRMGYVVQDGGLFPHLTARGNVTLMARHLRWPESRIRERLDELVELTKFPADGLDRYPVQISGGQRQRVGLMRALFLDPEVLFLDEPLGALDPLIRSDLQQDLRAIFRRLGKMVVFVTHDLAEARYFGDRIALLHEGRLVQLGSFAELEQQPADPFVTTFLRAQRFLREEEGA